MPPWPGPPGWHNATGEVKIANSNTNKEHFIPDPLLKQRAPETKSARNKERPKQRAPETKSARNKERRELNYTTAHQADKGLETFLCHRRACQRF
jgi:hypothetical protein